LVLTLHQLVAGLYLVSGVVAGAGLALSSQRLSRGAVGLLALGVLLHGVCFSLLHTLDPPPQLTDVAPAISFMAFAGAAALLLLLWRARLASLVVLVAPIAFVAVSYASLQLGTREPAAPVASGSVPHAHVLLASTGLALLGLAGVAGVLFLAEHRRLKRKQPMSRPLPSLEALDRVNAVALAVGFPLLTLGVVTGSMWVHAVHGAPWTGTWHEASSLIAWGIYGVLVALRFAWHQGARQCAASAVGGFAVLFIAVVGVGIFV
jgi:ABC-type uncharacterized transport system permease subunit